MNPLGQHVEAYLTLRRRLGFKLRGTGFLLRQFVRFAQANGTARITTSLAVRWATQRTESEPVTIAARYRTVRLFALYLNTLDSQSEVPPAGLLPYRKERKSPYLYSDQEVVHLVRAAKQLPSPKGLRGPTLSTLIGLLAATGMRIGEAIGLDRDHVNLPQALLTIHHGKGYRTRLIPLHPSVCTMLRRYECLRNRLCPHPLSPSFFISEQGRRLHDTRVREWFATVSRQIGLWKANARRGPRLHDLRHRFAIQTLLRWYRADVDVDAHMPELSTYLGHLHVSGTYWYLSAVPELLQLATRRWERRKGALDL